jgi:hypothetical protein
MPMLHWVCPPQRKTGCVYGNSITEGWLNTDPAFFKENKYINRGMAGKQRRKCWYASELM